MIIKRKVCVPPLPTPVVERPRLDDLINALVAAHGLVGIYAAAGAGKTTALAEALPQTQLPVAWLTLDGTDSSPQRLLAYLEAALAQHAPGAAGVASGALHEGVAPPEAAGLLAEAAGASPAVLVLDQLERVALAPEALEVISAVVRYAPSTLRIVLAGRRWPALDLDSSSALGRSAELRPDALAFTIEETAAVLAAEGATGLEPERVLELTGGWVAGVLFEARRASPEGEPEGLHAYLAAQVLEGLSPAQRAFLIATSLLPDVTAAAATALGQEGAAGLLADLRSVPLPAAMHDGGRRLRCHPRFREFLLAQLERLPAREVAALRRARGDLLVESGLHAEAVDEFLRAGATVAARSAAEHAFDTVLDRSDFEVAERWLQALRPAVPAGDDALTRAELTLAVAMERYAAGAELADALTARGERDSAVAGSSRAAAAIAGCLWATGRVQDARATLDLARGEEIAAIHYLLAATCEGRGAPAPPELAGGPLDGLALLACWAQGRLRELAGATGAVSVPWRISALCAMGRTQEALQLHETCEGHALASSWLRAVAEPALLIELGKISEARDSIMRGRDQIRVHGGVVAHVFNRLLEVKLELRSAGNAERAAALLRQLGAGAEARSMPFLLEQVDMWFGMALLRQDEEDAAAGRLRRATAAMKAANRILELPTAAVFLAEAEWRVGREGAARKAADLALEAAAAQGSNHLLLQALADFPAVATRRMELEDSADSEWHEIGRALMREGGGIAVHSRSRIRLVEFGQPLIEVDGVEVRARIKKSYELLAYLAGRPSYEADRDELLDALFDGRSDESTRSYLRQATHRLREVLPANVVLAFEGKRLRLSSDLVIVSDSSLVSELLARAAHCRGRERLEHLLEALSLIDRGAYLEGVASNWVDERRDQLLDVAADVRHEAALLLFGEADYGEAKRLAAAVLRSDPYREATWRLLMRIAKATGNEDGVVDAYRLCEQAMSEIGVTLSETTESLLATLRH